MFGSKRTLPFWRQGKQRLALERAFPHRVGNEQNAITAQALAGARARTRLAAQAKKKAHFAER
jgi:hypothetical protein